MVMKSVIKKLKIDKQKQYNRIMSMSTSEILRVFTNAKQELSLKQEMRRIYQLKENSRRRRKLMEENMKKMGKKIPGSNNKFDTSKMVDSLKDFRFHLMSPEQIQKQLKTNLKKGLTQQQAQKRLKQGENTLKQVKQTHWAIVFLQQMSDPFSLLVWFTIVLLFIGNFLLEDQNQLELAAVLVVMIISGAIISYGFARSSAQEIKNFKRFFPRFSNVIRNGELKTIKPTQIVPGDLIFFEPGDLIPADIRIIRSTGMKVNKATFTGQSQPVEIVLTQMTQPSLKHRIMSEQQPIQTKPGQQEEINKISTLNPLESTNMVFSGETNVEGEGIGVVCQTGDKLLISSIRDVLVNFQEKQSYLTKQIARFVKIISIFSVCVGLYTFFGGWLIGFPAPIAGDITIGVICASCPGVLNLQLTCILYLATRKLAKVSLISKTLVAVESLGSTQILCTDKTGTLTTNKLTIQSILYNNKIIKATNFEDFNKHYIHEYDVSDPTFIQLQKCAVLSSVADFNKSLPKDTITKIATRTDLQKSQKQLKIKEMEKQWQESYKKIKWSDRQVTGDSTESALIRFFQPIRDIKQLRAQFPVSRHNNQNRDNRILFNSHEKYSMSINYDSDEENADCTIYLKGAPQIVWQMCDSVLINGHKMDRTQLNNDLFLATINKWGDEGKRMIGFAKLPLAREKKTKTEKLISPERFLQQRQYRLKGLTFIGAVSMQDPPRKGIAQTMLKIKRAGIKVIVITGDIELTATSIARQCNLLTEQKTTSELMRQQKISFKQAFCKTKNIVINGPQLMQLIAEEQNLPESEQGREFLKIIYKPNVIFARTNPSQKLYIVQSLQKLGFVVTVTGDGVNDSPAIKIANTGIAMVSGSQAARDVCDIIIGNDDFNSIVIGIEEGRRLFDNFKKAICYVMTSQVQEWMPFIFLVISRVPIPIFTLLVDSAIDFVPTLAFAYQQSESGIMTRPPKFKEQHLVNFRLLSQCFGWMGFSSFLCCLFSYYIIMVDFGFVPSNLWGKSNDFIIVQKLWDKYNPTSKYLGNSNLQSLTSCAQFDKAKVAIDWINMTTESTDLRMSAVRCLTNQDGSIYFQQYFKFGPCRFQQISISTFKPVCYSPEATKYGQTSYMLSNVVNQVFNWIICRTRRDSGILKRFNNPIFVFGLAVEAMLAFGLAYTGPLCWMVGTRDVAFQHWGIAAIPFSIIQLLIDQLRKYLVRNLPPSKSGKPNWFEVNTLW